VKRNPVFSGLDLKVVPDRHRLLEDAIHQIASKYSIYEEEEKGKNEEEKIKQRRGLNRQCDKSKAHSVLLPLLQTRLETAHRLNNVILGDILVNLVVNNRG